MSTSLAPAGSTGTSLPDGSGNYDHGRVASRDVEFISKGMPTGVSLFVWLPEKRPRGLRAQGRQSEAIGRTFGQPGVGAGTVAREKAKDLRTNRLAQTLTEAEVVPHPGVPLTGHLDVDLGVDLGAMAASLASQVSNVIPPHG